MMLVVMILYLLYKNQKLDAELKKYKEVWKAIRETMDLRDNADPFVRVLPDARQDPFSGVWYNQEDAEEEAQMSDVRCFNGGHR